MPWFQQGPPLPSTPRPPTHSWIFVPLLHAAARRLTTSAERAWEADARFAGVWQRYVVLLRNAPPVPPEVLLHTLDALQQLATASGHPCPPAEAALLQSLAHETSCLPASTLAHFPWAWQLFTLPGGYIPATAQEALLQCFLGAEEASVLVQSLDASPVLAAAHVPQPAAGPEPDPVPPSSSSSASTSSGSSGSRDSSDSSHSNSNASISATQHIPPPPEAATAATSEPVEPAEPSPAVDDIPSACVSRGAPAHNSLQGRRLRDALAGLDACNASDVLRQPCATFRTPPACLSVKRCNLHSPKSRQLMTP